MQEEYSFAYLRENKLRTIRALSNGQTITFKNFCNHFGIKIETENIFKSGKYLNRIFRPMKHGNFFNDLDIFINETKGKIVDGLSIISKQLAQRLGWIDAD